MTLIDHPHTGEFLALLPRAPGKSASLSVLTQEVVRAICDPKPLEQKEETIALAMGRLFHGLDDPKTVHQADQMEDLALLCCNTWLYGDFPINHAPWVACMANLIHACGRSLDLISISDPTGTPTTIGHLFRSDDTLSPYLLLDPIAFKHNLLSKGTSPATGKSIRRTL